MNVLKKIITIAIIITSTISCKNHIDNESLRTININDVNKMDKIVLEDVFTVNFIQLQLQDTTKYIGEIKKIIYNDSCFCISDGKKIMFYDNNGRYKFAFDKLGKASEEYLQIDDFEINDGKIYILDKGLSKILTYNINDNLS